MRKRAVNASVGARGLPAVVGNADNSNVSKNSSRAGLIRSLLKFVVWTFLPAIRSATVAMACTPQSNPLACCCTLGKKAVTSVPRWKFLGCFLSDNLFAITLETFSILNWHWVPIAKLGAGKDNKIIIWWVPIAKLGAQVGVYSRTGCDWVPIVVPFNNIRKISS